MTVYNIPFISSLQDKYGKPADDDKWEDLEAFLKFYEGIIRVDAIRPIFSQTYKYDLFPKKKQYNRIRANKNVWAPSIPSSDVDKMQKIIKSILNKITDKNYDILIETLICELNKFKIVDILDLLVREIIGKISTDISYHSLYIKLCGRIWSMKHWHEQLISIVMDDDKFYWYRNTSNQENKLNGPYESEKDIREYTNKMINFRYCFLNAIQTEFNLRDKYLEENKKRILSVVEFIGLMYRKNLLGEKIIHLCLLNFLSYQREGVGIPQDGYIELFCTLWKTIDNGITIPFKTVYIIQYFTYIKNVVMTPKDSSAKLPMRIEFMLEDLIGKYYRKYENDGRGGNTTASVVGNGTVEKVFTEIEKIIDGYHSAKQMEETIYKLKKYENNVDLLIEICVDIAIEYQDRCKPMLELLHKIKYVFETDIKGYLENVINGHHPAMRENIVYFIKTSGYKSCAGLILLLD